MSYTDFVNFLNLYNFTNFYDCIRSLAPAIAEIILFSLGLVLLRRLLLGIIKGKVNI